MKVKFKQWMNKRTVPLNAVLTVPVLLQIIVAVVFTNGLYWYFAHRSIEDAIVQLQKQTAQQVSQKVVTYLQPSHQINEVNVNAIKNGLIDINDRRSVEKFFNSEIASFQASAILYANKQGGFLLTGNRINRRIISNTENFTAPGNYLTYLGDESGNRIKLLKRTTNYDPRQRPWYKSASEQKSETWGSPYNAFDDAHLVLALSQPVYDGSGQQIGVIASSIGLPELSLYLASLSISERGKVFVVDALTGRMIASSADEKMFDTQPHPEGIYPAQSQSLLIRQAAQIMAQSGYSSQYQQILNSDRERYFMQVTPVSDANLKWSIVTIIPEAEFTNKVKLANYSSALITVMLISIAIAVSILIVRCIVIPTRTIVAASKLIAERAEQQNGYEITTVPSSVVYEFGILIEAFNYMTQRFHEFNQQLQNTNSDLERRIIEQTAKVLQMLDYSRVLLRISRELCTMSDQQKIYDFAIHQLGSVLQVVYCNLVTYHLIGNSEGQIPDEYLEALQVSYLASPAAHDDTLLLPFDQFIDVYVQLLRGQPIQFCTTLSRPLNGKLTQATLLMCPMIDNGGLQGDLILVKYAEDTFDRSEIQLAQQVANHCAFALRQKREQQSPWQN